MPRIRNPFGALPDPPLIFKAGLHISFSVLILITIWSIPALGGTILATEEALAHLAELTARTPPQDADTTARQIFQIIYWLKEAANSGLDPNRAVALAIQRTGHVIPPANCAQLLTDWRMACAYGLLTSDNLRRLRDGTPPVVTEGPSKGRMITVVKIRQATAGLDLANAALAPQGGTLLPEARADAGDALQLPALLTSSPSSTSMPPPTDTTNNWRPPVPSIPAEVASDPTPTPRGIRPDQIELYEVEAGGSLSLDATRSLAVGLDAGEILSVSVIGEGKPVWVPNYYPRNTGNSAQSGKFYPRIRNSKVLKTNPVQLAAIDGRAYLVHSEGAARYYYIEDAFKHGGSYRIAKVVNIY